MMKAVTRCTLLRRIRPSPATKALAVQIRTDKTTAISTIKKSYSVQMASSGRGNAESPQNHLFSHGEDDRGQKQLDIMLITKGDYFLPIGRGSLQDWDFPDNYVKKKHPDDYKMLDEPVKPSFTVNHRGGHARLVFRVSWKIGNKYSPMSFIVDTGAISPIYFSTEAMELMTAHKLLLLDELQSDIIAVHTSNGSRVKVRYAETPPVYEPANLIGLRFILRFGLCVEENTFGFREKFEYF